MASIISVPNETNASYMRTTRDGRKLTYEMSVLQQPQRARACGSGAKSSADRRPVDPPPVVELKIFEGETAANRKDITFQHNANFFLYTTLESARPIAAARGASSVAAPHPVLTGMPVAGMAYLDRPTQAGYFIFPDLSVRHEGKFRLSFNLYEELKEAKDMDPEGTVPLAPSHEGNGMMRGNTVAHVHFRLEVKSAPFTVYSAKKFPGLAESTQLSRLVAEQGCRVRIRRDVRMRRREAKPGKEYDGYSDDEHQAYAPENRYATPESYHHERASSVNGNPPTIERRPSVHELPGYYPPPPPMAQQPPPAPQQSYSHPPPPAPQSQGYSHLQFGATAPPYQPGQPPYQPANSPYQYQQPPPAPHHRPSSSSGSNYAYPPRSTYNQPPSRPPYPDVDYNNRPRAPSGATYTYSDLPAVDQSYAGPLHPNDLRSATPSNNTPQLPPLKSLTETKYEQPPTPNGVVSSPAAYEPHSAPAPAPASTPTSAPPVSGGKRSYGRTFDDGQSNGLHNGARPDAVGQDFLQVECEDGSIVAENELPDYRTLTYRRADGSRQYKKINPYS